MSLESIFPNLKNTHYRQTSKSAGYNCIAHAIRDTLKVWWPTVDIFHKTYWPPGLPREETVEAFVAFFQSIGFESCDNNNYEQRYDKIAIYADEKGRVKHASRQLNDTFWTSKLGLNIDTEHEHRAVAGNNYGDVVAYMKRKTR